MFSEMGKEGALVNALKFVGRDNPKQLVADKFGWNDFSDNEWKQIRQMFSKMGKEGALVRELVDNGFTTDKFTKEEKNIISQKYIKMAQQVTRVGISDEEVVKKIAENNSVDAICKAILSKRNGRHCRTITNRCEMQ